MMKMIDPKTWSIWRVKFRYVDKKGKSKEKSRPFVIIGVDVDRIRGYKMTSRSWHDSDPRYYHIQEYDGTSLTEETWIDLEQVGPTLDDFEGLMGVLSERDQIDFQISLNRYMGLKRKGLV